MQQDVTGAWPAQAGHLLVVCSVPASVPSDAGARPAPRAAARLQMVERWMQWARRWEMSLLKEFMILMALEVMPAGGPARR